MLFFFFFMRSQGAKGKLKKKKKGDSLNERLLGRAENECRGNHLGKSFIWEENLDEIVGGK